MQVTNTAEIAEKTGKFFSKTAAFLRQQHGGLPKAGARATCCDAPSGLSEPEILRPEA